MTTVASGRRRLVPLAGLLIALPVIWLLTRGFTMIDEPVEVTMPDAWVAVAGSDTLWRSQVVSRLMDHPSPGDTGWAGACNALLLERVLAALPGGDTLPPLEAAFVDQHAREARVAAMLLDGRPDTTLVSDNDVRQAMPQVLTLRVVDAWAAVDSATAAVIAGLTRSGSPFFRAGAFKEKRKLAKLFEEIALRYGEADPALETALAGLDKGGIAGPVFANGAWWVLRVSHLEPLRPTSQRLFDLWEPWVRAMLVGRKLRPEVDEVWARTRRDAEFQVDERGFDALLAELDELLPHRTARELSPARTIVTWPPAWAEGLDPDAANGPLLTVQTVDDTITWTRGQALQRMAVSPWPPAWSEPADTFAARVRQSLVNTAALELLDRQAQRYLDGETSAARHDSLLWADYTRARSQLLRHASGLARSKPSRSLRELLWSDLNGPMDELADSLARDVSLKLRITPLDSIDLELPPSTQLHRVFLTRPASPPPAAYPWAHQLGWVVLQAKPAETMTSRRTR